jgi:hypothetical protein
VEGGVIEEGAYQFEYTVYNRIWEEKKK